ncbi:hypothetical protein G210_3706 [Candida maltosa Xu316]|uniref:Uncharacterized protein n=1 Tax=Candida maltosa (strain Xu316) TaxID=1245528 RepID=M3HFQ0_CANMX|nr:hypothetical protein G210_3706 [Candida maltosa Xu316]
MSVTTDKHNNNQIDQRDRDPQHISISEYRDSSYQVYTMRELVIVRRDNV